MDEPWSDKWRRNGCVIEIDTDGIIIDKKPDIDAFSKGELDFETFYTRAQILTNWSGTARAGQEIGYGRSVGAR